MNLEQLTKRVQRQFGDESEAEITTEDIRNYLNDAQMDVVRHTECLQDSVETDSVAGQRNYILPTNFLFVKRVTFGGRKLNPVNLEDLDEEYPSREAEPSSGEPQVFYLWNNQIYLYPTPASDGSGNLDIMYIRIPDDLENPTDVPEIPVAYHEDLVRFALSRAKELDEETVDAQRIWTDYTERVAFTKDSSKVQDISSYPSVRLVGGDE